MRRILINDVKSGYTTVTEITLSSTTGVNKESYISMPRSTDTDKSNATAQTNLLTGIVDSVGQLTKIVDSINMQKQMPDESSLTDRMIDVIIDEVTTARKFISVNTESIIIPNNTLVKSIKLAIENQFPVGSTITLFFNSTILAKINVRDSSVESYELKINKYIKYEDNEGNNMNIEVYSDSVDPTTEGWVSPKAVMHISTAMEINEI